MGLANADVIKGGGESLNADRGRGKILLTSYVNAPLFVCKIPLLALGIKQPIGQARASLNILILLFCIHYTSVQTS